MTVSAAAGPFRYTGNGVTTLFSVPELFYSEDHLQVTVDGVDQVIDVDYTVTGVGESSGGTVVFTTAPALNAAIVINHVVGYVQETDFENFDGNPSDVTEKQFDLCVRMAQQNNEKLSRAITIPVEDSNITTELPNAAARAGGVVYFDGSGNVGITTATDTVSAAAAAASAAAAAASATAAATAQSAAEAAAAGLKWRPSVRIASTANRSLSGLAAIDGVTPVAGDRVLLKDQTTTSQNGVYIAASGAWTRATDADSWTELVCQVVAVEEGSTNADKIYICTVNAGGTIGSTAITWTSINVSPIVASQAEAEAGTNNTNMMTPLRVKQAVDKYVITPWETFTPTFTGFGTATSITGRRRRVGANLEIEIKFTHGTTTGTEARVSFNDGSGAGSGVVSSSTYTTTEICGQLATSNTLGTYLLHPLIEPSVGYLTFASTNASGLTKQNANSIATASGDTWSVRASIRISGW